ncbi:MAG TPA: DUF3830 family protein [Candidatus Limnocylindria bacterium]|nr:DUF3830 family protein [Candidatus Limnocylindria bacterium]
MRRITLELEGVTATARLLDEAAPETTRQLWDQLPYADRFTHSFRSGLMIHSNEHPAFTLDVSRYPLIENAVGYIAPGDVVVWPQNGMLSIAYASTEFRWLNGVWPVTKVAEIEGDLGPFAKAAYAMMFEGARALRIARGGSAPAAAALPAGAKLVEIELDDETWIAELFFDEAPEYAQAVWDALPLEGWTNLTHSSGETLHFWVQVPEPKPPKVAPKIIPVERRGEKVGVTSVAYDPKAMRGQHPGDLVWGSTWNGIRIIAGQGRFGTGGKFGRIVSGDLASLAAKARRIPWDGAKYMKMRKHPG